MTIDYVSLARTIGELVQTKQQAYGDSFGKSGEVLKLLYPNGVKVAQYRDMLAITRILDKLFRIATDRDALGESPYRDIAGYALLGVTTAPEPMCLACGVNIIPKGNMYSCDVCEDMYGLVPDWDEVMCLRWKNGEGRHD